MAPILSKVARKSTLEDLARKAFRKAKPVLESFLDLVKATLESSGGVFGETKKKLSDLADKVVLTSVRFMQDMCCLDIMTFTRGPKKARQMQGSLPILFVLFILVMLYNAFVFSYMPAAGLAFNSRTSIIFHAFIFLTLSSFMQAARRDPGRVPKTAAWTDFHNPPPDVTETKRNVGADDAEATTNGSASSAAEFSQRRWCRKEGAYKPDRAHYCRVMGRGVLRMDHHCPWLGNTIGWGNHKFFYLFLFYTNCACGMLGVGILDLLFKFMLPPLDTFLLSGAGGLVAILSAILVPFFAFHTWLISRNMTTIEFCAALSKEEGGSWTTSSVYDLGLWRNLASVLGDNPLLWLFPVGDPPGDGIHFRRRNQEGAYVDQDDATTAAGDEDLDAHPEIVGGGANKGKVPPGTLQEALPAASADDGGFLVWTSAAEFTDDLRVGCEFLGEKAEDSVLSFLSLCSGGRKKALLRQSRVCVVKLNRGGESDGSDAHSRGSQSGAEFFSDF